MHQKRLCTLLWATYAGQDLCSALTCEVCCGVKVRSHVYNPPGFLDRAGSVQHSITGKADIFRQHATTPTGKQGGLLLWAQNKMRAGELSKQLGRLCLARMSHRAGSAP